LLQPILLRNIATMAKTDPKRLGRPPAGEKALSEALTIRFPAAMMRQIEELQAARLDQPEKGALIRELVAEALLARGKRKT
jgi:hypothetical protein